MAARDWQSENPELVGILKGKLGSQGDCLAIVDQCDELMASIWRFVARLLDEGGTRAVVGRSIQLAARNGPLLQKLQLREEGVDFSALRDHVAENGCGPSEVLDAYLLLANAIFHTLSEFTADAVTGPLLRHLEEA